MNIREIFWKGFYEYKYYLPMSMTRTTISVEEEVRDQLRELKGFERTYNELLIEELIQNDE